MCEFFSAIVEESGKIYFGKNGVHSHSDIEERNKLVDDGRINRVKIEFNIGEYAKTLDDFENYVFKVNEAVIPEWWNAGYKNDAINQIKQEIQRQIKAGIIFSSLFGCPGLTSLPEGESK